MLKVPVASENQVEIVGQFYDVNSSTEEQQEALVYYNNTYFQNKGIDYADPEGEAFEVTAALSGTVTEAKKDSLLGYVVELNHGNDIVTHYNSLESIDVEVGDTVKQGDALGVAGLNLYNSEAGVHVHFQLRQDGVPVNPNELFEQPIESIVDNSKEEDKEAADEEDKEVTDEEDKEDTDEEGSKKSEEETVQEQE